MQTLTKTSSPKPKRAALDRDFIARICHVAQRAKADGFDDVSAWMQQHLAGDIVKRREQSGRKRGVQVKLAKAHGAPAVLDAQRVREMMSDG